MDELLLNQCLVQISRHEGFRSKPYKCPAGYLTIGYGRNLETNGISKEEADYFLKNDIRNSEEDCRSIFYNWDKICQRRKTALIDLRFWLGYSNFRRFARMIVAVRNSDFALAASEVWNSRLPQQAYNRTKVLHDMLRDG